MKKLVLIIAAMMSAFGLNAQNNGGVSKLSHLEVAESSAKEKWSEVKIIPGSEKIARIDDESAAVLVRNTDLTCSIFIVDKGNKAEKIACEGEVNDICTIDGKIIFCGRKDGKAFAGMLPMYKGESEAVKSRNAVLYCVDDADCANNVAAYLDQNKHIHIVFSAFHDTEQYYSLYQFSIMNSDSCKRIDYPKNMTIEDICAVDSYFLTVGNSTNDFSMTKPCLSVVAFEKYKDFKYRGSKNINYKSVKGERKHPVLKYYNTEMAVLGFATGDDSEHSSVVNILGFDGKKMNLSPVNVLSTRDDTPSDIYDIAVEGDNISASAIVKMKYFNDRTETGVYNFDLKYKIKYDGDAIIPKGSQEYHSGVNVSEDYFIFAGTETDNLLVLWDKTFSVKYTKYDTKYSLPVSISSQPLQNLDLHLTPAKTALKMDNSQLKTFKARRTEK